MQNRVHLIDAIRGFCLLNIFVNHLTVGALYALSPSRIGFSDSAEAFVFLAGMACFFAYGPRDGVALFPARAARMWSRARTLFAFYLALSVASVAVLMVGVNWAEPETPSLHPATLIEQHGLATYAWHVVTMQQSVGFSVVLRLYVILMLGAPFYVWLAAKRFWYPLVPAGLLWVLAGQFGWAERESLTGIKLALTILPWNLVFAGGVALGAALVQRVELPKSRMLALLAGAVVLAGPVCFVIGARVSPDIATWIDTRNDYFWTGASKTLQSPLRVAHIFALAYLIVALRKAPGLRLIHQVSPGNPFCRLGRRSLQVFTCGAILATAANYLLWGLFSHGLVERSTASAMLIELGLVVFAWFAMLWVADRGAPARAVASGAVPFAPANLA